MNFEQQYLAAVKNVLETGERSSNRTGIDTLFKLGLYMEIDMADGFPLLTTKKVPWKSAFAEQLGFIRGYDNAANFRDLGTKVWDQNANENERWLANPRRTGQDNLGRIYGVQSRHWESWYDYSFCGEIDQLQEVYNDLNKGVDNRREIVSHWNPGEMDQMALPPCHVMYQFGLREQGSTLDLALYVRSNDIGLGMPFNVAQYAWLLHLMSVITGHKPGRLLYFAFNYHIYVNHVEALQEQLKREPKKPPQLVIHPRCSNLKFLEETPLPIEQWSWVENYEPWPAIKMEMAV